MDSLEIILERYAGAPLSQEEKVQLATEKNEIYKKLLMEMSSEDLSDEVKTTLENLRKLGLKLAIGSSSRNARLILSRIGLEDFFDGISDGTNIEKSKPDPEVFIKAAAMVNLEPKECLVIEDAKAGIDAAHNGGMDSAGIGDAADYSLASYSLTRFSQITDLIF